MADQGAPIPGGLTGRIRSGRLLEKLDIFADAATILTILFGLTSKDHARKTLEGKSKDNPLYSWFLSILYPLSDIDERIRNQLLYNAAEVLNISDLKDRFFRFVDNLEKHGWDPDHFRIMMIIMYKDYLDSDKGVHCGANTAFGIVKDLYDLDGKYDEQEYLANHLSLLSKAGPLKKMFKWMHAHKLWTLVFLFLIPATIAKLTFRFFLTIFG